MSDEVECIRISDSIEYIPPRQHPEILLLKAILYRAIWDYLKLDHLSSFNERREAKDWIFGDPEPDELIGRTDKRFTFDHVCSLLDIDGNRVRDYVRYWRRQLESDGIHRNGFRTVNPPPFMELLKRFGN